MTELTDERIAELADSYSTGRAQGDYEFARAVEREVRVLTGYARPGSYVNAAGISAADMPHTVVEKLDAAALLASQAKQAVQPPEFQEVSWGVDSVMRPCKSMAISEYAFRRWAETNGIALALPAPIEQITPENTDGVNPSSQDQPKGGA